MTADGRSETTTVTIRTAAAQRTAGIQARRAGIECGAACRLLSSDGRARQAFVLPRRRRQRPLVRGIKPWRSLTEMQLWRVRECRSAALDDGYDAHSGAAPKGLPGERAVTSLLLPKQIPDTCEREAHFRIRAGPDRGRNAVSYRERSQRGIPARRKVFRFYTAA
jgi:hypothetical protein